MSTSRSSYDLLNVSGPLTIETILRTLQQRFNDGYCYTWMGSALLCVNPFEPPSAVTLCILQELVRKLLSELAEASSRQKSVGLVFSGVCGSGKSFTADQLLVKVFQTVQRTDWLQDLRKYWQVSSVVLKALGSVATQSNKDASRIGRMVDFHFKGLQITKVKINCFFLDQSRLVNPSPHEQNYSILYQLLAGLTADERKKYHLNYHDVHTLHYLSQGYPPKETQQQLQNHFEAWKSSLAQLGIPLTDVVKVLVATLLLGNVLFYEAKNQELSMQGLEELQAVGSLLGVDPALLQQGLTLRTYHSERGEEVRSQCSAAASNGARDALAKALYIRTVVAIMRRINTLLRGASHRSGSASRTRTQTSTAEDRSLHVIDLFGWEANEVNSLEHLCINWSSERLQQHYITSMFRDTIDECTAEGVDPLFESSLYDCGPCIELIGGLQSGLLQLLNQETLSPRVSSDDIRHRIRDRFQNNHCFVPSVASSSTFTIRHFAGDVVYDIYSLLNANADTLADDIISTFNSKDCKFGFVAHLFAVELNRDLRPDGSPQGQMCRITPAYLQHAPHSSEVKQPTTYVQDFQSNIEDVFSVLKNSKPYYVRCIKSNTSQTPGYFDKETVQHQVQYMAVFETVDLIQTGFCHRFLFDEFLVRYRHLSTDFGLSLLPNTRDSVEHLLASVSQVIEDIDVSEDNYALGTTKVFLNEEFYQSLEQLRQRVLSRAVVKIQASVRMYLCRKHWPQLKYSLQQAKLQGEAHSQLRDMPGATPHTNVNGERVYTVRNYTIVGNYKVGFPQWRVMRCHYPDHGPSMLKAGDEVFVLGRSQKRGFLIIEHSGRQIHMPHNYTELRLTPPTSPAPPQPVAPPKLTRATPPQGYSDL